MGELTLKRSDNGNFELPAGCLHCLSQNELTPRVLTLHKSTPLQFLAILPFVMAGPYLKTEPAAVGVALGLALSILLLGQLKAKVHTAVCATCRKRRAQATVGVLGCFLLGFVMLVWGSAIDNLFVALSGIMVIMGGLASGWAVTRDSEITLLGKQGEDLLVRIPEHKPAAWKIRNPRL